MTVVASLFAYAFVGGVVHRALVLHGNRVTGNVEDVAACIWPLIPVMFLVSWTYSVLRWAFVQPIRAGQLVPELPGRLLAWAHSREWRPGRRRGDRIPPARVVR